MTEDQEKALHEEWRRQYFEREKERRKEAKSIFARIRHIFCPKKLLSQDMDVDSKVDFRKSLREYSRAELAEYYQALADSLADGDRRDADED